MCLVCFRQDPTSHACVRAGCRVLCSGEAIHVTRAELGQVTRPLAAPHGLKLQRSHPRPRPFPRENATHIYGHVTRSKPVILREIERERLCHSFVFEEVQQVRTIS